MLLKYKAERRNDRKEIGLLAIERETGSVADSKGKWSFTST